MENSNINIFTAEGNWKFFHFPRGNEAPITFWGASVSLTSQLTVDHLDFSSFDSFRSTFIDWDQQIITDSR